MKDLLKKFKRQRAGVWTCLTTTAVGGVTIPSGATIRAGTPYDGVDFGEVLEEEHAKQFPMDESQRTREG